jgi:hypothetical protein
MPALFPSFLKLMHDATPQKYPVFIETGTLSGFSFMQMAPHFAHAHTIELSELFFSNNASRLPQLPNYHYHCGYSPDVLAKILPSIDQPVIFFLDAHNSGGNTALGPNGEICPLLNELQSIMENLTTNCVIIIDDARDMGNPLGWSHVTRKSVTDLVASRLTESYFLPDETHPEDRMILHLSRKTE